jgi:hypothetical protein
MPALGQRQQLAVGLALALLMTAARGNHAGILSQLPGASWAVFFLAGVYLRPRWAFAALMAQAVVIDAIAVGWAGVSDYCLTPAYGMLLPAYAGLWLAGRWYVARHALSLRSLVRLAAAVLAGAASCELLASGGFYFLSGRFAEPTLAEFGRRLAQYFPQDLQAMALWIGFAALVHVALAAMRARAAIRA